MYRYNLTLNELTLLDIVWELGEATVQQVCDALERDLAYTTVMTMLSRLVDNKGVLTREKRGQSYVYRAVITREQVSRCLLEDLRPVLFRDSLPSLMMKMIAENSFSENDIATLRGAMREIETMK